MQLYCDIFHVLKCDIWTKYGQFWHNQVSCAGVIKNKSVLTSASVFAMATAWIGLFASVISQHFFFKKSDSLYSTIKHKHSLLMSLLYRNRKMVITTSYMVKNILCFSLLTRISSCENESQKPVGCILFFGLHSSEWWN